MHHQQFSCLSLSQNGKRHNIIIICGNLVFSLGTAIIMSPFSTVARWILFISLFHRFLSLFLRISIGIIP